MGAGLVLAAALAISAFNAMSVSFGSDTLYPASDPSLASLCTQPVQASVDGTVAPVFCADGSINTTAWSKLAADNLRVMRLGRKAGPGDVRQAVTSDLKHEAGARECSAAQLAAAYNGWNFHISPVSGLSLDCPLLE